MNRPGPTESASSPSPGLTVEKRVLDVGCGWNKTPGAIGIDSNARAHADVIHDLGVLPYPFANDEFDEVVCRHVAEHVPDVMAFMTELFRITRIRTGRPIPRTAITLTAIPLTASSKSARSFPFTLKLSSSRSAPMCHWQTFGGPLVLNCSSTSINVGPACDSPGSSGSSI